MLAVGCECLCFCFGVLLNLVCKRFVVNFCAYDREDWAIICLGVIPFLLYREYCTLHYITNTDITERIWKCSFPVLWNSLRSIGISSLLKVW